VVWLLCGTQRHKINHSIKFFCSIPSIIEWKFLHFLSIRCQRLEINVDSWIFIEGLASSILVFCLCGQCIWKFNTCMHFVTKGECKCWYEVTIYTCWVLCDEWSIAVVVKWLNEAPCRWDAKLVLPKVPFFIWYKSITGNRSVIKFYTYCTHL
jgi:hypothetical protein